MSGSLTCGDGENVPGIPGACAPAILHIWQEAHGKPAYVLYLFQQAVCGRLFLQCKLYFLFHAGAVTMDGKNGCICASYSEGSGIMVGLCLFSSVFVGIVSYPSLMVDGYIYKYCIIYNMYMIISLVYILQTFSNAHHSYSSLLIIFNSLCFV